MVAKYTILKSLSYKCTDMCLLSGCINLFNVYSLGLRPLAIAYVYAIGLSPRPLYIFSLDKDK